MNFANEHRAERLGQACGYVCSYTLFTIVLFIVLRLLDRIPVTWSVFHVAAVTLIIVLLAEGLRKVLQ